MKWMAAVLATALVAVTAPAYAAIDYDRYGRTVIDPVEISGFDAEATAVGLGSYGLAATLVFGPVLEIPWSGAAGFAGTVHTVVLTSIATGTYLEMRHSCESRGLEPYVSDGLEEHQKWEMQPTGWYWPKCQAIGARPQPAKAEAVAVSVARGPYKVGTVKAAPTGI